MPKVAVFLVGLLCWVVVGSVVLTLIDDEECSLYQWAGKAPYGLSWVVTVLWPVLLALWLVTRLKSR